MIKFWALTITAKLEIRRVWMDSNMVIAFLKENTGSKVYRASNDQEAKIIIAGPQDELVWVDVPQVG